MILKFCKDNVTWEVNYYFEAPRNRCLVEMKFVPNTCNKNVGKKGC